MLRTPAFLLCLIALTSVSCASSRPPLRSEPVKLGAWRASFADFAAARRDICQAEPQWLKDDLVSVNGLLANWVKATEGTRDDAWPPPKLELLDEGTQQLPRVIEAHANNLKALSRCSFSASSGFPYVIQRGNEVVKLARERIDSAPALHAWLDFQRDLQRWKLEQPARAADARTLCSEKPRLGDAELYYAIEGETRTEYLFCDGSLVTEKPSGEREFHPPVEATARELKRVKVARYLEAAEKFPDDQVDRAPAPPDERVATSAAE